MLGCIPSPKSRVIHRSLIFEAVKEKKRSLLKNIFEALEATEDEKRGETESTRGVIKTEEKNDEKDEQVSNVVEVLGKLEQAHREHKVNLIQANQEIENPDVAKVIKMEHKIRNVKEFLRTEDNKITCLLDQPNAEGDTLMHITTRLEDIETTRLLLKHRANPNLQDAEGNSPLHTVCHQKDIHTTTVILRHNGRLLQNKMRNTPAIEELFFDQHKEDVNEMLDAINQSRFRKEFLEQILKKKYVLFRLVEEDKPEILSIVLRILRNSDQEEYVSLVRDGRDGNTALHLATLTHKSLKSAALLLEAGARLVTNADNRTPPIEDFFSDRNQDNITRPLVEGLVRRVESNQLDKTRALRLLLPNTKGRKSLFHKARGSYWGTIANWAGEQGIDLSNILPGLTEKEHEDMVEVARKGFWEKEKVHKLFCEEDEEKKVFLSRLPFKVQQEVAFWNQDRTNQIAFKMSADFIQWLIQETNKGNWNGEKLGGAFCQLNENNKLKLTTVDKELQKQLAILNKRKTCSSVPLLGNNLQHWIYKEALEGRWEQQMVFRVLARQEAGGKVLPVCNYGMNVCY